MQKISMMKPLQVKNYQFVDLYYDLYIIIDLYYMHFVEFFSPS